MKHIIEWGSVLQQIRYNELFLNDIRCASGKLWHVFSKLLKQHHPYFLIVKGGAN